MKRACYASAAVFAMLATPSMAERIEYACKVREAGNSGWIPTEIVIRHDTTTGAVMVADPVILATTGKPAAGKVNTDNAKRITFVWALAGMKDAEGQIAPTLQYRATVAKPSNKVTVNAKAPNFDNDFNGAGTCTKSSR